MRRVRHQNLSFFAGERAEYLLLNGHLQEANWFKERYRAWFLGDYVLGDGGMYLCTPIDPLFLALPLLESSRNKVDTMPPLLTFSRLLTGSIINL